MATKEASSTMEEIDEMFQDVHMKTVQLEDIVTKLGEKCQKHFGGHEIEECIAKAKQEAEKIAAEAEMRTEAMKIKINKWEEEKKRIAQRGTFESTVPINVGGHSRIRHLVKCFLVVMNSPRTRMALTSSIVMAPTSVRS